MRTVGASRRSDTERSKPRPTRGSESQGRRRANANALRKAVCETMERRIFLSAALDNQIPTSIAVNTGPQTLLSPGDNAGIVTSNSTSTATSAAYRFVVNNATDGQLTTFSTSAASSLSDSAIALYDASGNRLALQDASSGSTETLAIALQSGQKYTVEFWELALPPLIFSATINTHINPGPQTTADTLTFNPATGTGSLSTSNAPDAFLQSADVRYFPVSLMDAGQTGTLTITPNGPDTSISATLFEQAVANGAWTKVSSTTLAVGAASATLGITPPSGADITDAAAYELAVAPLNFTAAPEPVTLSVSASPLLAPTSVSPSSAHLGIAELVASPGSLTSTTFSSFTSNAGLLADIISPVSGPMTVTVTPTSSFGAVLGIYEPAGSPLIAVTSSKTVSTTVTTTFNAVAGTGYFFLIAPDDTTTTSGTFTISTSQSYTPTPLAVGSSIGTQVNLPIANSNGMIPFQLTTPVGSNFLALQLTPTVGTLQTEITIAGPTQVQQFLASGPGQPVTVVIDQSQFPGPYDVLLSGVGGTGSGATFQYIALTAPNTIPLNSLPNVNMNVATGGLTSAVLPTTTGTLAGVQYFQLATNAPLTLSTYSSTTANGAAAVLLHYVQNGSVLQLAESKTPGLNGVASVTDVAPGLQCMRSWRCR